MTQIGIREHEAEFFRSLHDRWKKSGLQRGEAMVCNRKLSTDQLVSNTRATIDSFRSIRKPQIASVILNTYGFTLRNIPFNTVYVAIHQDNSLAFRQWFKSGGSKELRLYPWLSHIIIVTDEMHVQFKLEKLRRTCHGCHTIELDPSLFFTNFPEAEQDAGKKCVKLSDCSGCRRVGYCSPECQQKDWPTHRETCQKAEVVADEAITKPLLLVAFLEPINVHVK